MRLRRNPCGRQAHFRLPLLAAISLTALGCSTATIAEAAVAPRPVILSLSASAKHGRPLPAAGDAVVVTVDVRNATRCTFLRQYSTFSSLYPLRTVACGSGHASLTVPPIANRYKAAVHLTYAVRVQGASSRPVERKVKLAQAAADASKQPAGLSPTTVSAPLPPAANLSIGSSSVASTGGSVLLTFSSTNASSCSLSSTPAFWPGGNPVSVSCDGTYTAVVAPSDAGRQWMFTFTAANAAGQSAVASQTLIQEAPAPPTPAWAQSSNWSGYVVPSSSSPFTEASGEWTVPALNCAATPDGGAGIWVGIGGYRWPAGGTSGALLQTGVTANCVGGIQLDVSWFEEVPSSPNRSEEFAGLSVAPGDSIKASVYQTSDGAWETRLDDLTTGLSGVMITGEGWGVSADAGDGTFAEQGSTSGLSYSGGYSAEWIVEDYAEGGAQVPFADYGVLTFTGLTTSLPSWSLTTSEGEELIQNGTVVSTPSVPSADGFSVTYTG